MTIMTNNLLLYNRHCSSFLLKTSLTTQFSDDPGICVFSCPHPDRMKNDFINDKQSSIILVYSLAGMAILINPTDWTKYTMLGHLFVF